MVLSHETTFSSCEQSSFVSHHLDSTRVFIQHLKRQRPDGGVEMRSEASERTTPLTARRPAAGARTGPGPGPGPEAPVPPQDLTALLL